MSDTTVNTAPGPVVELTRIQTRIRAIVSAVLYVALVVFGLDLSGLDDKINGLLTLVVLIVGVALEIYHFVRVRVLAWRTRSFVTPVDNPRDDLGRALAPRA